MRRRVRPVLTALLAVLPAPVSAGDQADIIAARTFAEPVMGGECDFITGEDGTPGGYDNVYRFTYRSKGQDQDSPDYRRTLVQLACASGADNVTSIYLLRDDDAGAWQLLSFAEPVADFDYADENFSRLKAPPKVTGYIAVTRMTNSDFAEDGRTITAGAKWRGAGDAWSSGEWRFEDGAFVLKRYEIDPTFEPPDDGTQDPEAPGSYVLFDATVPGR